MFRRFKALLATAFLLPIADSAFALCKESYTPIVNTPEAVYASLAKSVFLISVPGRQHGSGFLIDNRRGLVVTAYHVVRAALKDGSNGRILAESSAFPGKPIEMRVVPGFATRPTAETDIALLEPVDLGSLLAVHSETPINLLKPIEVHFDRPPDASAGLGVGYPRLSAGTLSHKPLTFGKVSDDGLVLIPYEFEQGFSGGPALTLSGGTPGVLVRNHEYRELTYMAQAALAAIDLLEAVKESEGAGLVQRMALDDRISVAQFEQYLLPSPAPLAVTNIDLVLAAVRLKQETGATQLREKMACLHAALGQRNLYTGAYRDMVAFEVQSDRDRGRAFLEAGPAFERLGAPTLAATAFANAERFLYSAVESDAARQPELYEPLFCRVGLSVANLGTGVSGAVDIVPGSSGQVGIAQPQSSCLSVRTDRTVSAMLRDYATASLKASELGSDGGRGQPLLGNAATASLMAAMVAESSNARGASLALFGKANERLGIHYLSSKAFANAYEDGYQPPWIVGEWKYNHERTPETSEWVSPNVVIRQQPEFYERLLDDDRNLVADSVRPDRLAPGYFTFQPSLGGDIKG